MNKGIKFFIIAAFLLIFSITKEPYQCDPKGEYRCGLEQTCCERKEGWRCYNNKQGVCCSDGLKACPKDNICTTENTCEPKPLTFLDDEIQN
jgi:hypothetical protein